MIDIAILASGAVSALVPYLIKGGEAIAGEAGKNLFSWVKEKLHLVKKEKDLNSFLQNPEDAKIQGRVEVILEDLLSNNKVLIDELSKLTERAQEETTNIVGSKNVVNAPISSGRDTIVGDNNQVS